MAGWIKRIIWVLPLFVLWGCQAKLSNSATQATRDVPGKRLFEENCAACHGISGHGNMTMLQGKAVHFDDPKFLKMRTDEQLKQTIRNGRGMMPEFDDTFSEIELNALVQYIRSLGKPAS